MPLHSATQIKISNLDILSFTLDNPQYDVNKPIFIDPSNPRISFSHAEAVSLIRRLIAGLRLAGLKAADTVCIHSFNSIIYPILCLAIIGAGGTFVGTNPSYTKSELLHALRTAKVKFVLSEPELVESMHTTMTNYGMDIDQRLFILNHREGQQVAPGFRSWRQLCDGREEDWVRFDCEQRQTETTAGLFFTSGTTGLPKCAMVSHRNLVAQHQIFWESNPRDYEIRTVHVFPLYHIGSFPTVIISQLKGGSQAYIMRRFNLYSWLSYHERYTITELFLPPPVVIQVVMSRLADPSSPEHKYSLKTVRNGYVGAAPLSGDMQQRFHKLLGDGARFTQIWGMTETTSASTSVPNHVADLTAAGKLDSWGSIGMPLPEVQIKLIDEKGNDTTFQGLGEACVKGPTVIQGYFENEKANHESWDADGYFRSGDVMQVDLNTGFLRVVERHKELIKVRGFQVAPAELEGVLTLHSDIVDAAVIGIPDVQSGEVPRAYVVPRKGASPTTAEIKSFMGNQLARYKSLDGGVIFVDHIPRLPSGKILKRVIREWAAKERVTSKQKL